MVKSCTHINVTYIKIISHRGACFCDEYFRYTYLYLKNKSAVSDSKKRLDGLEVVTVTLVHLYWLLLPCTTFTYKGKHTEPTDQKACGQSGQTASIQPRHFDEGYVFFSMHCALYPHTVISFLLWIKSGPI